MKKKVSLQEMMGSGAKERGEKMELDDLGELLGERMPKLEYNPVGRLRLVTALRNRFGDSYRTLPGIEDIMRDFDEQAKFNVKLAEMRMIKMKHKGGS